ncbi:bestrophin-4 isoform X2 [Daphnia magna]|uniref:bestrophin-4 isoform X2 n=1 Tax=Daphnia magna TaxID=35525 RepID=UPI001E1BBB47|nr:bestrophin-4 isoform X2 [Daphnia magna]
MMHYERSKSQVFQVPSALAVAQTAPDANRFGECICILTRWKGSIYKLVWRNLLLYYALYYMLTILHKFILDEDGQKTFVALAKYCSRNENSFNFMIMLGFFTSTAMQRLFSMQTMMPGTAKVIGCFTLAIKPNMPEGPFIVEQFARWTVIAWILTFRLVSKPLRDLYPDMFSLQTAGILRDKERLILERVEADAENSTPRPLVAIDWMLLLLKETSTHNRFAEKSSHLKLVEAVLAFKKSCGNTIKFGTHNIPHALIQAAIIMVYAFGLLTLMARNLEDDGDEDNHLANNIISYFPILPSMQFFIFLAWLKFGRAAVNPFGTDETDIDIKRLLKTHIQDSLRLTRLYTQNLEDFFGTMPQHQYNETDVVHL